MNIDKEFDKKFNYFPDNYYDFVVGKDGTKYENCASSLEDIKQFYNTKISKLLGDIIEVGICQRPQIIKLINNSEFKHLINK